MLKEIFDFHFSGNRISTYYFSHYFFRTLKKLLVQNAPILLWNGMRMKSEIELQHELQSR